MIGFPVNWQFIAGFYAIVSRCWIRDIYVIPVQYKQKPLEHDVPQNVAFKTLWNEHIRCCAKSWTRWLEKSRSPNQFFFSHREVQRQPDSTCRAELTEVKNTTIEINCWSVRAVKSGEMNSTLWNKFTHDESLVWMFLSILFLRWDGGGACLLKLWRVPCRFKYVSTCQPLNPEFSAVCY